MTKVYTGYTPTKANADLDALWRGVAVTHVPAAYGAIITPDASAGSLAIITPTDGVAFVLHLPTNLRTGQVFRVRIVNVFGALGAFTGGANVKLATWTQPANGFNRTITFEYDGTNLTEIGRTTADVPN